MAATQTAVGVSETGDRWFWLRGTLGAVGLLAVLGGQFIVPKFIVLLVELGLSDLPIMPVMLTVWTGRALGGLSGYILLDLILLACVALAAVPARPGAWRTVKWVLVICVSCLGAVYALGLCGTLFALAQVSSSLSA